MAGIYIHIPFCKQACHYCDFHFSTSMKKKDEMILALANEIKLRKREFENEIVETIYFGGGTPSILQITDLRFLIERGFVKMNSISKKIISLSQTLLLRKKFHKYFLHPLSIQYLE